MVGYVIPNLSKASRPAKYSLAGRDSNREMAMTSTTTRTYHTTCPSPLPLPKEGSLRSANLPPPLTKPHGYWEAQCIFRGLSSNGTIEQLQVALMGREKDPMIGRSTSAGSQDGGGVAREE